MIAIIGGIFCIVKVQGRNCPTDLHGMSLTRDRFRSLIRKWQMLIATPMHFSVQIS